MNFICCRKNHTTAHSFDKPQDALDYAEEDFSVAYIRRASDGLIIARRALVLNPVYEFESVR